MTLEPQFIRQRSNPTHPLTNHLHRNKSKPPNLPHSLKPNAINTFKTRSYIFQTTSLSKAIPGIMTSPNQKMGLENITRLWPAISAAAPSLMVGQISLYIAKNPNQLSMLPTIATKCICNTSQLIAVTITL